MAPEDDAAADGPPRVLYAGVLGAGELCRVRMDALEQAGAECTGFAYDPWYDWIASSIALRALRKLDRRFVLGGMNRALRAACRRVAPDVLYVDKGVDFTRATLRAIRRDARRDGRRLLLFHYHPDAAFDPLVCTRQYVGSFREYDCHFCPHRWVVEEHLERGARRGVYLPYAFDPATHYREFRYDPGDPETRDVVFVGRYERERIGWLEQLAHSGVAVHVWGPNWPAQLREGDLLHWQGHFADFADQRRAYGKSRISLGLLSYTNHDGHTARTFEVPACGGFMLAERSTGQREFFEEGREMACFGSVEELIRQVHHYLENEPQREALREAGYRRSQESGYTFAGRMRRVLDEIRSLS